jgi:hypothetical protein
MGPTFIHANQLDGNIPPSKLAGHAKSNIPLPPELASFLMLNQGRGVRITHDACELDVKDIVGVSSDYLTLNKPVRNLRLRLSGVLWEWDSAHTCWFKYPTWDSKSGWNGRRGPNQDAIPRTGEDDPLTGHDADADIVEELK